MSSRPTTVSSRRKQAKPQRFSNEHAASLQLNGNAAQQESTSDSNPETCCGRLSDAEAPADDAKAAASTQKEKSITPPTSDSEPTPIDLSRRNELENLERKNVLEDKSNLIFEPTEILQRHQQQLFELYTQMAASQGFKTDSEQSSEDGRVNSSYPLSPPSSNESSEKIYPCAADNCLQRFSSRGALLWHVLRRHSNQKLLKCATCSEKFSDPDQVREHQCGTTPRPSSAGALLRSTSPDADRGSVPATTASFTVLSKSPSPAPSAMSTNMSSEGNFLPQMLFSQLFNAASIPTSPALSAKSAALDLSSTAPQPPFIPMPSMANPLLRAPFNFGLCPPQQSAPRAPFISHPSTAASVLNNDDDWEALMEVTTTDEAEKIRALVGDKVMPTTDPNQCILCRRVLSCKSALQMHYRTHTGERPFKCKICQRAFTTKGNLKTHMGVHRAKHSFRGITASSVQHQCPICPKRFFTAQLLQQHIAQHTSELSRNSLLPPFESPIGPFERRTDQPPMPNITESPSKNPLANVAGPCPSGPSLIPGFPPPFPFFPLGLQHSLATSMKSSMANSPRSPQPASLSINTPTKSESVTSANHISQAHSNNSRTEAAGDKIESTSKEHQALPLNLRSILSTSMADHKADEVEKPTPCSVPQATTPLINIAPAIVSFKNFLSQPLHSASIRLGKTELTSNTSNCAEEQSKSSEADKGDKTPMTQEPCSSNIDDEESIDDVASSEDMEKADEDDRHSDSNDEDKMMSFEDSNSGDKKGNGENVSDPLVAMQKMWAETEPPPPRQAPVLSKHQCGVCFKHFSSSSALQIHMRTHTGDKPFKCEVCSRAFTTRGNLKVHMGTHMWQQNPSRRGRRIFEFGGEGGSPSELLSPLGLNLEAGGHHGVESSLRPPFTEGVRPGPSPFPALPFPLPMIPTSTSVPTSTSSNQMEAMMWMWRTVCSVCQKICASPQELEQHLTLHLNATINVNGSTLPLMVLQKSE